MTDQPVDVNCHSVGSFLNLTCFHGHFLACVCPVVVFIVTTDEEERKQKLYPAIQRSFIQSVSHYSVFNQLTN